MQPLSSLHVVADRVCSCLIVCLSQPPHEQERTCFYFGGQNTARILALGCRKLKTPLLLIYFLFFWSSVLLVVRQWCCTWAAGAGELEVLAWCVENGCQFDKTVCSAAAREGHLEVLMWARSKVCVEFVIFIFLLRTLGPTLLPQFSIPGFLLGRNRTLVAAVVDDKP